MPNSMTHLAAASRVLADKSILAVLPFLQSPELRGLFYLGSIAPDARALTGADREETHFLTVPPGNQSAEEDMMARYPELHMPRDQVQIAFLAGYLAHLWLDEIWLRQIVMPHLYREGQKWDHGHPHWRKYSFLMTACETEAAAALTREQLDSLRAAVPDRLIPFIPDLALSQWRDHALTHMARGPLGTSRLFYQTNDLTEASMLKIIQTEDAFEQEIHPLTRSDLANFFLLVDQSAIKAILRLMGNHPAAGSDED